VVGYFRRRRCAGEKAGLDFVEIHAGTLSDQQFSAPLFNRRTDRYGGSFDNRIDS